MGGDQGISFLSCVQEQSVYEVDIDDYKRELTLELSKAWKFAQSEPKASKRSSMITGP